uniref:Uncharacterized protein n=1 Tax=Gossypium raimondii TaxID=29730 RepID=A0A0D2S419_GOSRA|nr:hypothetical protein B456_007G120100 [Gossypium raimondii]
MVDLDEETMKSLIEEAVRKFTKAMNEAQSRRSHPEDGGGNTGAGGQASSFSGVSKFGSNLCIFKIY